MTLYTEEHVLMLEKGNISCEDFEAALCDYADGTLPNSLKARVEDHACKCLECAEVKRTYLLTVKLACLLRNEKSATLDVQNRLRENLNAKLKLSLKPVGQPLH